MRAFNCPHLSLRAIGVVAVAHAVPSHLIQTQSLELSANTCKRAKAAHEFKSVKARDYTCRETASISCQIGVRKVAPGPMKPRQAG